MTLTAITRSLATDDSSRTDAVDEAQELEETT